MLLAPTPKGETEISVVAVSLDSCAVIHPLSTILNAESLCSSWAVCLLPNLSVYRNEPQPSVASLVAH